MKTNKASIKESDLGRGDGFRYIAGMMEDRRHVPRVPVSMRVAQDDLPAIGFGYAQDISEQGLAVDAQALNEEGSIPEVGTLLQMRFMLPKSNTVITAQGRVVRVAREGTSPRLAMEFVRLSAGFRKEIVRYVTAQLKI